MLCYDRINGSFILKLKEKEGDPMAAIDMYLKSNMPSRAAKVLIEHDVRTNY